MTRREWGKNDPGYRGLIGLTLALSLGGFLVIFTLFAVVEAWGSNDPALSENATQILSTVAGGIIGVLAGYVGGIEAGQRRATTTDPTDDYPPTGGDPGEDE
jgi:hypothetical protein